MVVSTDSIASKRNAVAEESPLFDGTEIPIKELHAYLRGDWNVYGFLHKFPSVSMEQALAVELERDTREVIKSSIKCDAEIADGALVFERSEVPVKFLFDYLADVKSLKDFHWDFPDVLNEFTHDALATSGRILELDAYRGVENGVVHSDRRKSKRRSCVCRDPSADDFHVSALDGRTDLKGFPLQLPLG